jgi:hypothetical protein
MSFGGSGAFIGTPSTSAAGASLSAANTWTANQTWSIDDAGVNTVVDQATYVRNTTGTATAGIGTGLLFNIENGSGSLVSQARISAISRTVTAGSETGVITFGVANTGGAVAVTGFVSASGVTGTALVIGTISATGVITTNATISFATNQITYDSAQASRGGHAFTGTVNTSGARAFFVITPSANTGTTASTEVKNFEYVAYTKTWAAGALTTQREVVWNAPTYAFASASTITTAATMAITNAPQAGTNATITKARALWVQAGTSQFDGRVIDSAPNSAIADAELPASASSFYLNEAGNTLTVKVKYADGTTVKTGTIALT